LNSLELLIVGFILLIGSIVCIILNKNQRFTKNDKINTSLNIFNIYNLLINSFFLRRQNLVNQNMQKISLNIFKKIKKKKEMFINKE
jgi:hypothetical protein